MNMVTVTGNIVSKNGITLFFGDGTSQVLPAESFRTQAILEAVLPSLAKGAPTQIDLDAFSIGKAIEQVTNGAVKVDETDGKFTVSTQNGVVENADALRMHVEEAASSGSCKGLKLFMAAFIEMAKSRKHSADELLAFLKGADLPLADDGVILGFKVLNSDGDNGYMVDSHTGKVTQKLGSLVFMPASKVSDDRRNACGVGLHIAARSYLSGFWGGGKRLCLVRIRPDDVISVPFSERNKMRVCAYHIVKVFDDADAQRIVRGEPIETLPGAARMLMDAVAGNHIRITQRVEIKSTGELTVTDLFPTARRPAKLRRTRALGTKTVKMTVARVKAIAARSAPYEKKLERAQRAYDGGMSIRDISKKYSMDRESLGKNLRRKAGR